MDQSFWTFIAALGAAVAAAATVWYAILTRKTIRATLLSHVLTKYSSRERIEASQKLREYKKRNEELYEALERTKRKNEPLGIHATVSITSLNQEVHAARAYLSAFFWEVKTYCEAGYLDKKLVAAALGNAGHELYLELVEPLDWINTTFILNRDDYDDSVRLYFERSLKKYF